VAAGDRYSHRPTAGGANTYKLELQLAPSENARVRYANAGAIRQRGCDTPTRVRRTQPFLRYQEEGCFDPEVTHIASYSSLVVSVLPSAARGIAVPAGINNVLDRDPPFVPAVDVSGAAGSFNSYPIYDIMGREAFIALPIAF
jgi:hypothetical protein